MTAARWLTVKQASQRLGESLSAVYRLVESGRLTVRRTGTTGRHIVIEAGSLEAYERNTTVPAKVALGLVVPTSRRRAGPLTGALDGIRHGINCVPGICDVCRHTAPDRRRRQVR